MLLALQELALRIPANVFHGAAASFITSKYGADTIGVLGNQEILGHTAPTRSVLTS